MHSFSRFFPTYNSNRDKKRVKRNKSETVKVIKILFCLKFKTKRYKSEKDFVSKKKNKSDKFLIRKNIFNTRKNIFNR